MDHSKPLQWKVFRQNQMKSTKTKKRKTKYLIQPKTEDTPIQPNL